MRIDKDAFIAWAESRFGEVRVKGNEVMVCSPFCEKMGQNPDHKFKMWCNVAGGKRKLPEGVFRCWKTDTKGSLVNLVMTTDRISYNEAVDAICSVADAVAAEKKIEEFFKHKRFGLAPVEVQEEKKGLQLPHFTYPIRELYENNPNRVRVEQYLERRKLSPNKLLVCTRGEYRGRVIIPYYDREGKLIYFNGRLIRDVKNVPKYLGPPKTAGVGKGDVLYMATWPPLGDMVYLCEGEFDALTLAECGLAGAACGGKYLTQEQIELLRPHRVCLAVDNDEAGKQAYKTMGDQLVGNGIPVYFVRPPEGYKDWNEMLLDRQPALIKAYIETQSRDFTLWTL
tara:strand:- start:2118 stop:3137 length:1020 start_codon:yes stop_codon:yes gene_type:complete